MPGFDVLKKDLKVKERCFLEASAGTGKTFAIEHLVTRLLLEGVHLEEILIVTFTRAATLELKERIQKRIIAVHASLERGTSLYPYLEEIQDSRVALRRLKRALASFDEAKIFTIHSFCFHALQEDPVESDFVFEKEEESEGALLAHILLKDYFHSCSYLHPQQWEILLRSYSRDFQSLVEAVARLIEKRTPFEVGRHFDLIEKEFYQELNSLNASSEELYEVLRRSALNYEKMSTRSKELKVEVEKGLQAFGKSGFPFGSPLLEMKPEKLLKKAAEPHPLWQRIEANILPLLEEATNPEKILMLLAEGARKKMERVCHGRDLYFYEDLLLTMKKKVQDEAFASNVRKKYQAVFIDEFQDTDQAQWNIFKSLFVHDAYKGALYLIGDPKQSIYRFRHADLYTYMDAKQRFSREEHQSLLVNFRSHQGLTDAMNHLFSGIPDFLYLPRTNQKMRCPEIYASDLRAKKKWGDERGSIHFFEGEDEEELYHFIIHEIKRLHLSHKIPLAGFSILVKDRFQAEAFIEHARKEGLPTSTKKTKFLYESKGFEILEDLYEACLDPQDVSKQFKIFASPLFYYCESEFQKRDEKLFFELKELFIEKGIFAVLKKLIDPLRMSQFEGGLQLYAELMQIAGLIAEKESSFEGFLPLLKEIKQKAREIDARMATESDSVQILTMHVSKGLEYEVVFPIGLIRTHSQKKEIVLDAMSQVLTCREDAFEAHLKELEAEKMRLLYVACTRARERLYLPLLKKSKKGNSPMELFLEKLNITSSTSLMNMHPEITFSNCENLETLEWNKNVSSCEVKGDVIQVPHFQSVVVQSFSSLAQTQKIVKSPEGLPAGKEFGLFLHELMEKIPFQNFERELKSALEKSPYMQWKDEIFSMVSSALHLNLLDFSLSDLDPKRLLREQEFLYKEGGTYMKGVIDLIFEHRGVLYFLDYKSNVIETTLEDEMRMGDYYLQAKIYETALQKYMKLFSSKLRYGGAFYLFLRHPEKLWIKP